MSTRKNNTQNTVQVESENGNTTIWVDPARARNLVANGWHVVGEQAVEQTATAEVEVKIQPAWVGSSRNLFLAILSVASRSEGVGVDELTSALGVSKETIYLTAGEMVRANYLAKVKHPRDGRKSIYIASAMPKAWDESEVESILADFRKRATAHEVAETGMLFMPKKPEQPKECAMAKAMAKDVHILERNVDAYQRMLDFMARYPDNLTQELDEINREYIKLLKDRIKSVQYDCPKCRACGTVKNNNGAAYCTKCKVSIDGFGSFKANLDVLRSIAKATKEDD